MGFWMLTGSFGKKVQRGDVAFEYRQMVTLILAPS